MLCIELRDDSVPAVGSKDLASGKRKLKCPSLERASVVHVINVL